MSIADDWERAGDDIRPLTAYTDEPLTAEEAALDAAHEFAKHVAQKTYDIKVRDAAARQFRADQRGLQPQPPRIRLDEFLAHDYGTPTYRIADLWPTGGRVLLTAQWKAGKTTVVGNTIRALVDGQPFLDRYPVTGGANVVLIDNELNEATLQAWLRDQNIAATANVSVISLRGRAATFDILDDDVRHEWARLLAGADIIIFDCLRPVLDALGLDENHDAGRFLVAFDTLLADCGASEALIVHHMGHIGERSRGDSRLQDWPDALWKVVRDKDDEDDTLDNPAGSRYFSAFGRDVDVRQSELQYDPTTRHLSLNEHALTRPQATAHRQSVKADEAIMLIVTNHPGITKTGLRKSCALDHGVGRHDTVDSSIERLVQTGLILRTVKGHTHYHYLGDATQTLHVPNVPNVPRADGHIHVPNVPPAPLKGGALGMMWGTSQPPASAQPTIVPEHTHPAPTCTDCGWPLDHAGHVAYCEGGTP